MISSVNSSEQCKRKLCITDSAPALPSNVTCQVNASPRAFSDRNSFSDWGNEYLHSSNILGSSPLQTGTPEDENSDVKIVDNVEKKQSRRYVYLPRVIMAPINNQPACMRFNESLEFWLADRSSSSAVLKTTFPFVCGIPSGDWLTLPSTAANALLYPDIASGDARIVSMASTKRSISRVIWLGTATQIHLHEAMMEETFFFL